MLAKDETQSLERLPRWARNEIERLRADVKSADARVRAALGEEKTRVEVERFRHMDGQSPCYLRDHATITFSVDGGTIDVNMRDGAVEIQGSDTIQIQPRASNLAWVRLQR